MYTSQIGRRRFAHLEPVNLLLDIVVQLPKPGPVPGIQTAELPLKDLLIQHLSHANTPPGRLVTVARTDTLTRGAHLATTEPSLLEAIDDGVQVEADVRAVGDEDALAGGSQTLFLQCGQLLEEARDVDDGASADEVDAGRGDETRGEDVEVVGHVVVDDGVAGIFDMKKRENQPLSLLSCCLFVPRVLGNK